MKRFLLLLFLLLLPVSAFAYDYTPEADVSFQEPFSEEVFSAAPGFSYRSTRAAYYFSPEISQEERDAFIDIQEKLLSHLEANALAAYVLPDYAPRAESAKRAVFLSPAGDDGLTQAIVTLQALYGETANYGLLFGAADALCREAGLPGYHPRFNERGMLRFYNNEENLPHFLLTYPSFTEDYCDKGTIPFVKDMAVRVFAFAQERGQAQALLSENDPSAFQAAFIPLINDFLSAQQAETKLYDHLPALAFGYGGKGCPLIISSPHGTWRVLSGFSDISSYWCEYGFSALYTAVWRAENDLSHVDECLGLNKTGLDFLFCAPGAYGLTTNYQHGAEGGPVALCTIDSLVHEYVHACVEGQYGQENAWFLTELAATYFELIGQYSAHDTLYRYLYNLTGDAKAYWEPVLKAMEAGRPLDGVWNPEKIYTYLCFARQEYDLFTPGTRTLNALRAFSYYLRAQFGDESVGAALRAGNAKEALGKSWEALRQDWQRHVQALYGPGAAL